MRRGSNNSPLKGKIGNSNEIKPVEMHSHDIFLGEQMLKLNAQKILGTEIMINNMLQAFEGQEEDLDQWNM